MTVRITSIEDVEISSDQTKYKLLILNGDNEILDFLLAFKIGSEFLNITIEGND